MSEKTYCVKTEGDPEGRTSKILGYCTGDIVDIKAYFEDMKYYNLYIEEITVIPITFEKTLQKVALTKEAETLEKRLAEIKKKVKWILK